MVSLLFTALGQFPPGRRFPPGQLLPMPTTLRTTDPMQIVPRTITPRKIALCANCPPDNPPHSITDPSEASWLCYVSY